VKFLGERRQRLPSPHRSNKPARLTASFLQAKEGADAEYKGFSVSPRTSQRERHSGHDRDAAAVLRDQVLAEIGQELAGRRGFRMEGAVEKPNVEGASIRQRPTD